MTITQSTIIQSEEFLSDLLHKTVRKWFYSQFQSFSQAQLQGVYPIHCRENILISAPTGSSKTLTAFLSVLNQLVDSADTDQLEERVYAIYVSPLKALNYDIEKNLKEPLEQMAQNNPAVANIRVGVRTGDTSQYQRQKMNKVPPHILITTPESLALLLASEKFLPHLKHVEWFIVDEIHAFAQNKRGTQLSLLMQHLQSHAGNYCRIGLSATVSPLDTIAQFLVGMKNDCQIAQISYEKETELTIFEPSNQLATDTHANIQRTIYDKLHDIIQTHKSTLIFTNTRSATEKVVYTLKTLHPNEYYEINEDPPFEKSSLIGAHHGSLSQMHRKDIEDKLKRGKLKCVVCSTSLELGLDIGYVDHVVLLHSPKQVARLIQRIGRSGHQLHAKTTGTIIVQNREDLVESSILTHMALTQSLDDIHVPTLCYDVLALYIVGRTLFESISKKELLEEVKQTYAFAQIDSYNFHEVLHYLSEDYPALEKFHSYPKITITDDMILARPSSKLAYRSNANTIADSGSVSVKIMDRTLGYIDEGFFESLKPRDIFVLGGDPYVYLYARGMTIQVREAQGRAPTVPRWFSQSLSLSAKGAEQIARLRVNISELPEQITHKKAVSELAKIYKLPTQTLEHIYTYHYEQRLMGLLQTRSTLPIEIYKDGPDVFHIIHCCLGKRANTVLAIIFPFLCKHVLHVDCKCAPHDTGIYIQAQKQLNIQKLFDTLCTHDVQKLFEQAIERTELLKHRFRQCAGRGLLFLRSYKGKTKHVSRQQMTSQLLLSAVRSISSHFILLKETMRELCEDVMDIQTVKVWVAQLQKRTIKLSIRQVKVPSMFGMPIIAQAYGDLLSPANKQEYMSNMYNMALASLSLDQGKKKNKIHIPIAEDTHADFTYEQFWDKQKPESPSKDITERLLSDMKFVSRKIELEPTIQYELYRLIQGETEGFTQPFKKWLAELFEDTVAKAWSDELLFYLKAKKEEL